MPYTTELIVQRSQLPTDTELINTEHLEPQLYGQRTSMLEFRIRIARVTTG
jgi:hypothetical protein